MNNSQNVPGSVPFDEETWQQLPDFLSNLPEPVCLHIWGDESAGAAEREAARLAKAAGAPVRVHWTREDEFRSSYFRPAGLVEVTSGCDARGKIVAWDFHNYNSGASELAPEL